MKMQHKIKDIQFVRGRGAGLYDRGSADCHYGRERYPHWFPKGTYKGDAVTDLTPEEVAEYNAGYESGVFGEKYL